MKLLEGKTILVTGATRGIGKGIATRLAEEGAKIAFTFVSSVEKAKAFESELATMGYCTAKRAMESFLILSIFKLSAIIVIGFETTKDWVSF